MMHQLKTFLCGWVPHYSVIYAYLRAIFSRHKLPPGPLVRLDRVERSHRTFLLDHSARTGPLFKALAWEQFWVCVVGLSPGRRLLREHGEHLKPLTIELKPLFPKGFLRQMQGEEHRNYRRLLVRAIRPEDFTTNVTNLENFVRHGLAGYAARQNELANSPDGYVSALNTIASMMLVQLFFGAEAGSDSFDRIMQGYHKLGPCGLVWNVGREQKAAFAEIRDHLLELIARPEQRPSGWAQSILGRMTSEGAPDATMLGNLIYMVEMGRYDTYLLFRWLTKFAADHPGLLERIGGENPAAPPDGKSLAEAFVLESLRAAQSERVMRRAQRDIVFDGILIPKFATVRICVWESHQSPGAFSDPFRFDPERFRSGDPGSDEFAPFGLDEHQCPFGDFSINLSVIFLRELARSYTVAPVADGLPVRGKHHWEPSSQFSVRLQPRAG